MSAGPRFRVGQRVRILDLGKAGHVRVPHYVRGQVAEVERYCGAYRNPEDLAYGRYDGPRIDLYRVRIAQGALWADYGGPAADELEIEVYDHWLAPAEERVPC
jgi:nitrile hydratase